MAHCGPGVYAVRPPVVLSVRHDKNRRTSFYRAMLQRVRYCHDKSSVCLSVCDVRGIVVT